MSQTFKRECIKKKKTTLDSLQSLQFTSMLVWRNNQREHNGTDIRSLL